VGGFHPHLGFLQPEVAQDAFDHVGLVDERHDALSGASARTPMSIPVRSYSHSQVLLLNQARATRFAATPPMVVKRPPP
jgi:hypothetical protein